MTRKSIRSLMFVGMMPILILLGTLIVGCSRSEPPPPPQQVQPEATAVPQAQPQQPQMQPSQPPTYTQPPVTASPQQAAPPASVAQPGSGAPSVAPAPSPQSFAQIQVGMTSQQVLQIMGNPGRVKQEYGGLEWEWYSPQGKFEVTLQNDRVVRMKSR